MDDAPIAGISARIDPTPNSKGLPVSLRGSGTMVAVLTLFAMLAAIDKNFLTLVVPDLKAGFGLNDVQIGLLIGLAFAVSNVAVSIPAGWLADHANRRLVAAGGVVLWSVFATTCGFARSFGQIFVARIGVGLGEGLSPPASYSLIRDGVAADRRGRAYAIFALGTPLGSGLAFVIGGVLMAAVRSVDLTGVAVLEGMRPWQIALGVIGLAGLPIALLAFVFPDPGRGQTVDHGRASFRETFATARTHWRVLLPLLVYSVLHAMVGAGMAAWVPTLLERTYHVAPSDFGATLGLVLMIGAPISLIGTGFLIDRLGKIGPATAAILASLLLVVAGGAAPHMPSIMAYWPFQIMIIMATPVYLPVVSTLVARVMPSTMIGLTMAFFLFFQGILGAGIGPLVVALFTEHTFPNAPLAVNSAITAVSLLFGGIALLAAISILLGSRRL